MSMSVLKLLLDPSENVRLEAVRVISSSQDILISLKEDQEIILMFEAIFRCFWLTDQKQKQFVISSIVHVFNGFRSLRLPPARYLGPFLDVFDKNWPGIDRFRLNKYYELVETILCSLNSLELLEVAKQMHRRCSDLNYRCTGMMMRLFYVLSLSADKFKLEDSGLLTEYILCLLDILAARPQLSKDLDVIATVNTCGETAKISSRLEHHLSQVSLPKGAREILANIYAALESPAVSK